MTARRPTVVAAASSKEAGDPHDRRVAITGIGVVSALGCGREAFWEALCAGRSGIGPAGDAGGADEVPRSVAAVRDFTPKAFIQSRHLRRMDRLSRMIVAAARMALADAGYPDPAALSDELGIVAGSAYGNLSESLVHMQRLVMRGPATVSPMLFPNMVMNAPASYAAMEVPATGTNLTVSQLEISGELPLLLGADLVRLDRRAARLVVAGGGDELSSIVRDIYRQAGALSSQHGGAEWASPYDAGRNGVVLGEGAAMLVLEPLERARARNAPVYAAIESAAGFSTPAPAYDWPEAAPEALAPLRAVLDGHRVDLVCSSANSTPRTDALELGVLDELFGDDARRVWLTSLKGAIGEFGAAGALTVAAAALALHHQAVPPLCHLRQAMPGMRFRLAAPTAEAALLERALVLGLARGGGGVALRLRRV